MSYTRRANFGKANPPLSSVGQRRPGAGNSFQNAQLMNRSYVQPGFQNKQHHQQQAPPPQQQNLQAQQQQFQAQLQQQEKARAALQQGQQNQKLNQVKPQNQKPPPQQQQIQKPPPAQQQQIQKPPPQQQQQIQKPPPQQQQQQQIQKSPPLQQQTAPKPQQQTAPKLEQPTANEQITQKPPQQQQVQQSNMQEVAEKLLADQSIDIKPTINTESSTDNATYADDVMDSESTTDNLGPHIKPRPFWMKRSGRINRAERAKRRNVRLRKLLQPKNALMIINELVGHVTFELVESSPSGNSEDMYKASVAVEGQDHFGFGKSKALAKTAAAEAAVRSMILNKLRIPAQIPGPVASPVAEEDKDVKMEFIDESQEDVSWTHIASFAIHKLFSSWGDDGNMADMISRSSSVGSLVESNVSLKDGIPTIQTQPEQKPAKKLPDNAALMNPIMLLNQMHPSAKYEELGKTGTPPHILFTIKCTVGNQSFVGTGPNKKAARKQATFEACKTLLGIQYPPDILEGTSPAKTTPMETV